MIRRWLIRGSALTLLTLCAVAWVGSHWMELQISYVGKMWNSIKWVNGDLVLGRTTAVAAPFSGFRVTHDRFLGNSDSRSDEEVNFLGFEYLNLAWGQWFSVPLLYPTLLSALLLWLVWRKTRPAYNGRGFPVEAAGKGIGDSQEEGYD
jgi:hypothetical protein